jgi:4-hydroxy-tetrahydrodipicolinate synthase
VAVASLAVGARGVVSVASNEAPAEMVQIIEMCERGDFAGARKLHHWLLPLIQVNFIESNPGPCKAAMAAMGLIEEVYRLPLVGPAAAARDRITSVLQQLKLLGAAARI